MFAEFGVPEVWRFDGEHLSMLRLRSGNYQPVETSEVFPGVPAAAIEQWLAQGRSLGRTGWLRLVLAWARERYSNCPR